MVFEHDRWIVYEKAMTPHHKAIAKIVLNVTQKKKQSLLTNFEQRLHTVDVIECLATRTNVNKFCSFFSLSKTIIVSFIDVRQLNTKLRWIYCWLCIWFVFVRFDRFTLVLIVFLLETSAAMYRFIVISLHFSYAIGVFFFVRQKRENLDSANSVGVLSRGKFRVTNSIHDFFFFFSNS